MKITLLLRKKLNILIELKKKKLYFGILKIIINNLISPRILDTNLFYIIHLSKHPDLSKYERFFKKYKISIKRFSELETYEKKMFEINECSKDDIEKLRFIFAVTNKNKCAGQLVWKSGTKFVSRSGYSLQPENKSAWIYNMALDEQYRLSPVFLYLIHEVTAYSQSQGISEMFGEINFDNIHSLKSHQRAGFEVYKVVYTVTICGHRFYFARDRGVQPV